MQQKLQGIVQSIGEKSLEHVHSDNVEQLVAQVQEVGEEIAKFQLMVKTFQDKVCPPAQPEPTPTT